MKKLALLTVLAALLLPVATAGASFNTTLRNVVANNGTEIDISVKTIDYYGKRQSRHLCGTVAPDRGCGFCGDGYDCQYGQYQCHP